MGDVESDTRTHHIHIVKWNGIEWKNYIHFRDYLNANENVALCYQKLKEELESKYADDTFDVVLNMGPFYHLLVEQMKEKQGVTEQLKADNQMLWVGKMNNIIVCAEEIVVRELVYA